MIPWLKFVHIAMLSIWAAGLMALPGIFLQRTGLKNDNRLFRLHRFARFAYVRVISPAAFVAVGSGIALIFANEVYAPWMALKLAAVGGMVLLHMQAGYIMVRLFDRDIRFATWRAALTLGGTLAAIGAILWLVLAKPALTFDFLPDWMTRPGGLQSLFDIRIPIP
ncbi:CopD family protein [Geminicoccus roseus]|uniref:CopD family protein n=1 Tax=Geminicoccus roseus TaxID=404900 RepID=UPI0004234CDE|nr:CopD family protein [Geminicoccus roseus]